MDAPLDLASRMGHDHLEATRRIGDILIRGAVGMKEAGFDALRFNLAHGLRAAESIAEGDAHAAVNRAPDVTDSATYLRAMSDLMLRTQGEIAEVMGDYAEACATHLAEGMATEQPWPMIAGMRQVTDFWRNSCQQAGLVSRAIVDGTLIEDAAEAASEAVQAAAGAARTAAGVLVPAAGQAEAVEPGGTRRQPARPRARRAR